MGLGHRKQGSVTNPPCDRLARDQLVSALHAAESLSTQVTGRARTCRPKVSRNSSGGRSALR